MNHLIEYFVRQKLFGNLITVFVIVVGIGALALIQREVFPNVTFDIITVNTIYPAASPEEVEKLITNPIEQDLKEVDGIKKLTSVSVEGRSYIVAQLDPDQTTEDQGKSDIQDVVDRIVLPDGIDRPIVTSVQSKQNPIIEVSLAGDIEELKLREIAKDLEKRIEKLPGIAKAVHRSLRDLEIRVEADPKKLSSYRVSLDDLISALKKQNVSVPGGTLEVASVASITDKEKIVRTIGEFKNLDDVLNTVVRSNEMGNPIRIRDLAQAYYAQEKASILNRTRGKTSFSLTILKKEKADAIDIVEAVKADLEKVEPELAKQGVSISYINDMSSFIKRRLSILTGNLLVGLILVFLVLVLILKWRAATLVTLAIPFSFLGTMLYFYMAGYSINLISLLGLIIVSGMLVDNAIVITDNTISLIESEGLSPAEAAIKGTQQIWLAITGSVLTTIIAFLPMMFMSGIFGKFVRQIPLGVLIALIISLLAAFFILPQQIANFLNLGKKPTHDPQSSTKKSFLDRINDFWEKGILTKYITTLRLLLKKRYWVGLASVGLFIFSLGLAKFGMKFILFPPDGIEAFFIKTESSQGASLEQTSERVRSIEKTVALLPDSELDNFVTYIGLQQNDPNDPASKRGGEYAQIAIYLTPENNRTRTADQIISELREKVIKPEGIEKITFERVRPGPPVGKPVSLSVRGLDYNNIKLGTDWLKDELSKMEGITDLNDSFAQGKQEYQVKVNSAEAAAAGLSVLSIGNTVRAAFDGIVATSIPELDEDIDVRVSFPKNAKSNESILNNILIPNPYGNLVPLSRVSSIHTGQGLSAHEHENQEREIKVFGDVKTNLLSPKEANQKIRNEILPSFYEKFKNLSVYFGGEDQDTQESMASLMRAFLVAVMGIFIVLVLVFQNLSQPFLVLITIPLGIISVIFAFFVHGKPLSFMGMLGIIALAGVIVNNAIVLVDFVNQKRKIGFDRFESIIESSKMRFRPIFLTTVTTVSGLLPTAYGIGGVDKFVVPIALALGWGLLFGSFLTAFVFPSAIAILDDIILFFNRFFKSKI